MAEGGTPARQRQLALLALCALGLLVAAFAAPQVDAGLGLGPGGPGESPDAPSGGGGGSGGGGDGIGFGDAIQELLEWLSDDEPGDRESGDATACAVRFVGEPTPGARLTVVVSDDSGRVEGARVSLGGEVVGTTDERGTVTVEVPYERELTLDATLPAGSSCSNTRATAGVEAAAASAAVVPVATSTGSAGSLRKSVAAQDWPGADDDGADADGPRVTQAVTVDGEVTIRVVGEPIPGERVAIAAAIDGEPMREATVSVDGQRVGRTDDEGRYGLDVPTDGRDSLTVRVERGEFAGRKTVDVTDLRAVVRPATILAIPGGDAVVVARLGNRTVQNATVTLGGERLGTTDAQGRLAFSMPTDPTAVIALQSGELTARQSLLPLYAVTALVVVLVVLGLALVVAKLRGRTDGVRRTATSLTDRLRRLARWLVGLAFRITAALEGLLDWLAARLGALRAALASLAGLGILGAVRESVTGALAWLLSLPGRLWAALVAALVWLRGLPGRLRASGADDTTPTADETVTATAGDEGGAPSGLRERWRAFARWVAPERWPQRTPGEVAREAAETGFPREPVRDLTRLFRDVEYGGRPETPEREDRSRAAFDALRDHREADGDDRPDDDREVTDRG